MNLEDNLTTHFRLTETLKKGLKRLKIEKIENLLYHFPNRYGSAHSISTIENLSIKTETGEKTIATIYGTIRDLQTGKTFRGGKSVAKATLSDDTGTIKLTWFGQPYLAKMFRENSIVKVEGQISQKKIGGFYTMINPKIEKADKIPINASGSLFSNNQDETENLITLDPVYSESKGVSSLWFYHIIQKIFKSGLLDNLIDPIPSEILEKYNLPTLKTALIWIHTPRKESDAKSARKRFSFEEIFFIQLKKQENRKQSESLNSYKIKKTEKETLDFINRFPFKLTDSQEKAIFDISQDLNSGKPMSRLLEGDVGSGKTAVAATAVYNVTTTVPPTSINKKGIQQNFGNLQTAYMVPTEILAKQHFENFIQYFAHTGIKIGLITSSGCKKFPSKVNPTESTNISRSQLLKWVANGEIPILVGTHSLIQKSVVFKNLALVIIDEQHRFGIEQRKKLAKKESFAPHLLSMTATPIPRTLALTIYGDLDLTLIDSMPLGRKPIITDIVLPSERKKAYDLMRREIKSGRQAYVICPRIDEPDPDQEKVLNARSVKAESKRLQEEVFPELKIEILHGKMKPKEKEDVMNQFENGKIDILVSTSVIEVGVNVPNSTIILIEGAERFGLAQLHQLRGRVIRSNHQAYCFVLTESQNQKSITRLRALKTAKNGFELAEQDLQIRGTGELSGNKQWGISDLGMEAIKNLKMVEAARNEAKDIIERIDQFPELKNKMENTEEIHFE